MASEDIAKQLNAALEECARLREENKRLRSLIAIPEEKPNAPVVEEGENRGRCQFKQHNPCTSVLYLPVQSHYFLRHDTKQLTRTEG
jgi:regulator of replication initiation timing